MNRETQIPLIFWHIRGHCNIKTSIVLYVISLKTAFIEGR